MSNKAVSFWRYNPILTKPRSLDPVRPWSWFYYYGPDPAAGVSYGQYHDPKNKFDIVTEKPEGDHVVYSPADGSTMEFISDVSYAELNDLLHKSTSNATKHKGKCTACAADFISDFDLSLPDELFCSKCGGGVQLIKEGLDSENKKGKTMGAKVSQKRVNNLKSRIRANIMKKRKAEAEKVEAKSRKVTKKPARRIKADEEMISVDSIMEAMEKEMEEESMDEAMMEDEIMDEEAEMGAYMEEDPMEEDEAMMEEEVEDIMEAEEDMEEEDMAMMEEEDEDSAEMDMMEEEGESGDDDEYMDLDMVISMIKKKEKLAKMKKKKAMQVKAKKQKLAELKKKKVKASDEGEPAEEDEMIEDDAMMEEEDEEKKAESESLEDAEDHGDPNDAPADEADAEEDTGSNMAEPDMVSEENEMPSEDEDSAAMKFEPLASVANLKDLKKEDIDMALYGEDTENPFWNVTVAGIPTARIQLKNQIAPEEIRAAFCSDDYAKDLIIHCEKTGFVKTMQNVKAEFWSNYTSNQKIAARYKEAAEKEFTTERKKMIASFRNDFRSCLNIVSAGLSKNFYPDLGNPLKDSLFTNLKQVGLPENTAVSAIEKSFQESAGEYFNSLFNKAEEYLNMAPQTRQEISAAISNGSSLNHYNSEAVDQRAPATLADRVAQASVVPESVAQAGPLKVNRELVLDTEDYKRQLKSLFNKR